MLRLKIMYGTAEKIIRYIMLHYGSTSTLQSRTDMEVAYNIISHRILSYQIISYHIISHNITSYYIITHHIISYHIRLRCALRKLSGHI